MNLTFLGTGTSQGVPVIACNCQVCKSNNLQDKRLRTSALITHKGKNILIDAGPDFRQQLLINNVTHIDAIIITHEHKDHIGGLDDVRALNYASGKEMEVYAEARVLEAIKREFPYAFAKKKYPGVPQIKLIEISNQIFDVQGITIIPIRVMHFRLPILGFRIASLTYITDANYISSSEISKIKGSSVLVLNALRKEKHLSHFSLSQAENIVQQVEAPENYFTHISHQLGLHNEIENELQVNTHLAFDGLSINIP